uniref:Uncharacterized protein n=1 Tax=Salix viminalis TaxID=40686 RepID=A0A6N2MLS5_SALVM
MDITKINAWGARALPSWNSSPIKNSQSKEATSLAVASQIFFTTSSPWRSGCSSQNHQETGRSTVTSRRKET